MTGDLDDLPWADIEAFRAWARPRSHPQDQHEDGTCGCLVWKGASTNSGTCPRGVYGGRYWSLRRPAWKLAHPDESLPPKDAALPIEGCDPLCIEPTHMVKRTASQFRRGVPKSLAGRLNMSRAALLARSPVKPEDVPAILADPRPAYKIAEERGCDRGTIEKIRNGKSGHVRVCNPFVQLMR